MDFIKSYKKTSMFRVILNGCGATKLQINRDIRKVYNLSREVFLFVCVGNVSRCKNQIQIVRAFQLLPKAYQHRIVVLFVGGNEAELADEIRTLDLQNSLITCGVVPKQEVHNYYGAADATILTSLSEGFGLSIIEGFVYGLPNLTFADLPAVEDLYDEKVMFRLNKREDEVLAEGMIEMVDRNWNRKFIEEYAKRFSFEKMADEYIDFYHTIISE